MSYIPTAPDLKTEIADTIRARRKTIANSKSLLGCFGTDREEAGRYTTVGGSLVTVHATIRSSQIHLYSGPKAGTDEQRLEVGAVAKCHGYGCTDPDFEDERNNYWLMDEDADEAARAALPHVQAAREWAQKHAEKCRAQAYTR